MDKVESYIKDIKNQVKYVYGGKVPEFLNLTIKLYARALALKDAYEDKMMQTGGPLICDNGSTGNTIRKQNPLCNLIYQQECVCQKYARDIGLTASKATLKPEDPDNLNASNSLNEFIEGIKG